MSAKGMGAMLLFLGIGSFVLPLIGLQFRIISIFGEGAWIAGLIATGVGILMMAAGKN